MGKLWKITMFNGKTMENHHFKLENYGKSQSLMGNLWKITMLTGKLWKITIFNGETMENHYV